MRVVKQVNIDNFSRFACQQRYWIHKNWIKNKLERERERMEVTKEIDVISSSLLVEFYSRKLI